MKLDIAERLTILGLLPREGDFTTLKIIRDLKNELSFSEEELEKSGIKSDERGMTTWKRDSVAEKDVKIGTKATEIIVDALKKLNNEKKLTESHISVFEKFQKGRDDL